jgi:ankyrin repeat protein
MNAQHEPGEIIGDRYRILETLGQGGNGITYKAECLKIGQSVALKALSLRQMQDWKPLQLFEREARILQQLNYPRIPRYLDYFHVDTPDNRAFYIVQELVEGQSLAAMVEKGWRTNEAGVRRIAAQVLEILVYLHDLKPPVIHRDIKPQNLIWGKEGNIFLVDFGAVRDKYNRTLARGSTIVGTYGYMAPEQCQGQAVPATDLYGLGATVLFLLTHRSPAELPEERLKISFRSRVQVSGSFADWLERMVEPDVGDRFSSAQEALDLLRGKVVVGKKRSPFPWIVLAGIGIVGVAAAIGLNTFQYQILSFLSLKPDRVCDAASAGNTKVIMDYFSKGGDLNITFDGDRTLLNCALESDRVNLVELLLDRGIDLNTRDAQLETPLHLALRNSQKDIAKLLIEKGANVNAKNREGHLPIQLAFNREWKDIADLLLLKGAALNAEVINDPYLHDYTLLHIAVENEWLDWTKRLIAKGANVNAKMVADWTALHIAVRKGKTELVKLLIDNGANTNAKAEEGGMTGQNSLTPLHILLKGGAFVGFLPLERQSEEARPPRPPIISEDTRAAIAKLLIDNRLDVNQKSSSNAGSVRGTSISLLHYTAATGDRKIAEMLIAKGVDLNARDGIGETPLHLAVRKGQEGVAELLISKGADINIQNNKGQTPLQMMADRAAIYQVLPQHRKVVQILVSKGADANLNSKTLLTLGLQYDLKEIVERLFPNDADMSKMGYLLHHAANNGSPNVAELLISRGVDVNVRDKYGKTSLHWAVKKGKRQIVTFLIRKDADVNVRDRSGYTPLHQAWDNNWNSEEGIVSFLIDNGANVNSKDQTGRTPIYYCKSASSRIIAELDLLISKGADVNSTDIYGFTPLHWLAWSTDPKSSHPAGVAQAALLISRGAKVNAKDFYGKTPLYWAMRRNNSNLVSLLQLYGGVTSCEALQCPEIGTTQIQIPFQVP